MIRKKPATYEDIEALPTPMVGEIVDDELYGTPRPAWGHQRAVAALERILGDGFDRGRNGRGGWWIAEDVEVHLGRDVLVPDLAGWRVERMPNAPSASEPFIALAPDWVCEVLSPGTVSLDRGKKKRAYARHGVSHVWLVDPLERTLEVLALEQGRWVELDIFVDQQSFRAAPFEQLEIPLDALWR